MDYKPTTRSLKAFEYFVRCEDTKRLPEIPFSVNGQSAAICFFVKETHGVSLPCCEPELLSRALNGKEQHGLTVTMIAEDFAINRLAFAEEIKTNYPDWVSNEIFQRARQIANERIGFVPTFVATANDFSSFAATIAARVVD